MIFDLYDDNRKKGINYKESKLMRQKLCKTERN